MLSDESSAFSMSWKPADGIAFKPSKTERSSAKRVMVPLSEDAKAVLARAQSLGKVRSIYVIHTEHGQPYTAGGIASLFKRACARAGVTGVTLKDIRAKAATDAKERGYGEGQIQVALSAHRPQDNARVPSRSRLADERGDDGTAEEDSQTG